MGEIQIFSSPQFGDIRTAGDAEQPLFCLADVCKAIGIKNSRNVRKRLDEEDVHSVDTPTDGGVQSMAYVTEAGLYSVIMRSDNETTKPFRKYVTSEVLPAIRKTGGYMVARADETPEEVMARALRVADDTLKRRDARIKALEAENEQKTVRLELQDEEIKKSAPKVNYYDEVLQSKNNETTTQIANTLGMSTQKLNKKLKDIGIQYKQSGQYILRVPYNAWKLHATRTQPITCSEGCPGTRKYTVWTQRGVRFIVALSQNEWDVQKAIAAINGTQQ